MVDEVIVFDAKAFEEYCEKEDAEYEERINLLEQGY
jgi:hypothetical protein